MDLRTYYASVFPRLQRGFQHASYALGYGRGLLEHGWDPKGLLVTVRPVEELWDLAVEKGLEVFIPVVGARGRSLLLPFDFELALPDPTPLYRTPASQLALFERHLAPLVHWLRARLEGFGLPHVLDYTPSGGHVLVHVLRGGRAWEALERIGWVDEPVYRAYDVEDEGDLKRNPAPGPAVARAFAGLGFLAEYLALLALQEAPRAPEVPLALWDSREHCMSLDLSWAADPAYMRIIRAPFGAHKKRAEKFHLGPNPQVDVMGRYWDGGATDVRCDDFPHLVRCMWDLDAAAEHAQSFPGWIPFAEEGMVRLVEAYEQSPLKGFHDWCRDGERGLAPGEALHRALNDPRLGAHVKEILTHPYPRLLQPAVVRRLVAELRLRGSWHPRHVKDLLADRYREPWHGWGIDFRKYSPDLKAWAFARQYSTEAHLEHDGWRV